MSLHIVNIHGEIEGDYDIVTALPQNATNGDVIKAMFPNLEWINRNKDVDFYYLDSDTPYTPKLSTFRSWWNAPYKAESEE